MGLGLGLGLGRGRGSGPGCMLNPPTSAPMICSSMNDPVMLTSTMATMQENATLTGKLRDVEADQEALHDITTLPQPLLPC